MKVSFDQVAARASANGTYRFTRLQLFSAYMVLTGSPSSGQRTMRLLAALGFILLGAPFAMLLGSTAGCCFAVFSGGVLLSWNMWPRQDFQNFKKLYQERIASGQPISGLLPEGALEQAPPPAVEPDIHQYGAQRLLLVEDNATVDLLVSNGFHAQHQVVVSSMSGYPQYLSPMVSGLLQNPNLQIFLFHRPNKPGAWHTSRLMHDPRIGNRGPNIMSCGMEKDDGLLSIPELKNWARACKEQFSTDMVPYSALAGLLGESINTRKPISRILADRRAAQRRSSGGVSGGYYDGGGHDFG